ncbi:MAG TPA: type VI secretion system baseplate subunit TssG [Gemmataceae bacterium]|nr:type VI secretion system baseplate subunit TssG [Gemmataceae bacterium]
MAAPSRHPAAPVSPGPEGGLEAWLYREPYCFRFFQAVRLLQLMAPDGQPVGQGANSPGREVVRFRARLSLSFPPSELYDLGWAAFPLDYAGAVRPAPPADDGPPPPPTLTVAFMGLTGPLGVLPRHVTDRLITLDEARERDHPEKDALRAWLDLFNHRLVSLFYRAWEKYRFYLSYERGGSVGPDPDHFTHALLSLVGLGTEGLRGRLRVSTPDRAAVPLAWVDDLALLNYGGFLAQRHRCAVSLEAFLEDYFGVPVAVEQFRGQWLYLDEPRQSSLAAEGGNNALGVDTVAGTAVWDARSKFRVRVGPLRYHQFNAFLPDRTPLPERKTFFLLCQLVRFYAGPDLDFDVQLVLAAQDVPECRLSDDDAVFPRLGWNSWSGPLAGGGDACDAVFNAEEM